MMKFLLHKKNTQVVVFAREVVVKTRGYRLDSIQADVEYELEKRGVMVETNEHWCEEGLYAVLLMRRVYPD